MAYRTLSPTPCPDRHVPLAWRWLLLTRLELWFLAIGIGRMLLPDTRAYITTNAESALYALILSGLTLVVGVVGVRRGRRAIALLRHGELVTGSPVAEEVISGESPTYRVTYAFTIAGREWWCDGTSSEQERHEPVQILCDPETGEAELVGNLIWQPRIDHDRLPGVPRLHATVAAIAMGITLVLLVLAGISVVTG